MGFALLKSSSFPPAIIAKSPDLANGSPPETGASINLTPFEVHLSAIICETRGSIDDISITKLFRDAPDKIPPLPVIACSDSGLF